MRRLTSDAIIGGVLLVFCVTVYLMIPTQVPALRRYDASMGLSPAVFPKLAVFFIAGFSLILVLFGQRFSNGESEDHRALRWEAGVRRIITFGILIAYVFLIDIFGYLIITPLTLAFLMWYFGEKRWLLILTLAILITVGLFAFFRYFMYIILPEGIFFS
ncbi:MAG: tripartite tricarboxylate transporter TctB family protein [Desulfobacterales bacterium]|jgi:hypothetical protein